MKNIFKTMLLLAAVTTTTGAFVSCSDDDDLPAADALFRPIINETDNIETGLDENKIPYMVVTWDNYTNADQYTVSVEPADGSVAAKEVTTSELKCKFDNLEYDKEYFVYISSKNSQSGLSSKPFSLTTTTPDFPTSLTTPASTDLIDTQARIKWNAANYSSLKIYKDSNDSLVADTVVTDDINAAKEIIFKGLDPKTSYRVEAFTNGAYQGKKRFSTTPAENFEGAVFDLRNMTEDESWTYITADQVAQDVADNPDQDITYVLAGGVKYRASGLNLPGTSKTIKFVTGLTLAGNAIIVSNGGIAGVAGQDIAGIEFEKIDFISSYINDGSYDLYENHTKGWGGRQVFNINNYKATIGKLSFKNCSMTGYRAVVRGQQDGDNINNIVLEDCVINGIGDQGVFTTTNKNEDWQSITMKNCTVTNIVMLCDLRKTTNTLKFTIENCTFCYAPIETTANANTPMFRLGSGNVDLTLKNTLFGPSMATGATKDGVFTQDSNGGDIWTYHPGVAGSIFVSGTFGNLNVEQSYKTDFAWTDLNASAEGGDPKIYPLEGLGELGISETSLWSDPTVGIFTIAGKVSGVDLSKLGAARWQ